MWYEHYVKNKDLLRKKLNDILVNKKGIKKLVEKSGDNFDLDKCLDLLFDNLIATKKGIPFEPTIVFKLINMF